MMNRRQMLKSLLAATSGTAVPGLLWRAQEIDALELWEGPAYEPWKKWREETGLRFAVSAAILAASPHNTQPWRFRIGDQRVDLFSDPGRTIGAIDPLRREQQIGAGCALENLLLGAESAGFGVHDLGYDPDPASAKIASIAFTRQSACESALCQAIPHRHTNRGPYQPGRLVSATFMRQMERLNTDPELVRLYLWTSEASHRDMKELIVTASEALVADREQSLDSARWYRPTPAAVARWRDGITLDAQGLSPTMTALIKMLPEPSASMADRVFLNRTRTVHCGPGVVFGTIAAREPAGKEARVRIGRLWQRMHLCATVNGLAMQPLNQVHERIDREATTPVAPAFTADLAGLIGEPDWSGLFTFRMGYAVNPAKPSPRRDLAQFLE